MAITPPPTLDPAPDVPNSNDPEVTFDSMFEAFLSYLKNVFVTTVNAIAAACYGNALDSQGSATAAQASATAAELAALNAGSTANFKGDWSALSGGLAPPASVYHNGLSWNLLYFVANVALAEPGVSPAWRANNTVFPVVTVNTATTTMLAGFEYEVVYAGQVTLTMPAQVQGVGVVVTVCNGRRDTVLLRASPTDSFMGKPPDDMTLVKQGRWALRALSNSWRGF